MEDGAACNVEAPVEEVESAPVEGDYVEERELWEPGSVSGLWDLTRSAYGGRDEEAEDSEDEELDGEGGVGEGEEGAGEGYGQHGDCLARGGEGVAGGKGRLR